MENHPLNEASDLSPAVRPLVQFTHAAVSVSVRPLCDSRYGKLHAGKLPFRFDHELDSHRPEIRILEDRSSRRTSGLGMAYVEIIQGSVFHMVSPFFIEIQRLRNTPATLLIVEDHNDLNSS